MAHRTRLILGTGALLIRTALGLAVSASMAIAAGAVHPGKAVYEKKCAECHGANGQGVEGEYDEALYGDRSLKSLARLIERTMPEENPKECVGEEAQTVADYIYREFYSPQARESKGLAKPARVELSRLTVEQYRNSVADVLASVDRKRQSSQGGRVRRPASSIEAGFPGTYYSSKGMNKTDKFGFRRTDSTIDFDFGKESPQEESQPVEEPPKPAAEPKADAGEDAGENSRDGEKKEEQEKPKAKPEIPADQFAIVWEGALAARETGHYEFKVSTQNGARLYLNSDARSRRGGLRDDSSEKGQKALIDGWVSSGREVRHLTARVFLLGGRQYPIRLEFFKYKEPTASIRLEWKPPHGVWSLLSAEHLSSARMARTFVVDTPFPADDRSHGYERGTAVSKEWHSAITKAAIVTTEEIMGQLPRYTGVDEKTPDREAKLREFCEDFVAAAFRHPLSNGEKQRAVHAVFKDAPNLEAAVKRSIILALESPQFLYPDLSPPNAKPDPYTIASRLSYALWDSIPDRELLEAVARDELEDPSALNAQTRRMLADPRAKTKMRGFFRHWLEMEERDPTKDKTLFPGFDEATIADLRLSLELFVERTLWSEESDYRHLLLADYLLLNERLSKLYGGDSKAGDAAFAQTGKPDPKRAGVLTHPYLLSAFAYHNNTSPIHRGVFLTRNIIGRALKPPPKAVAFKDSEFDPTLTMREKVTELTRDAACMSCHSVINPLGFSLEEFDAIGRLRETDNKKPINTESQYTTLDGDTIKIGSARDVATFASGSDAAHRMFVAKLFQHLVKQSPGAYGGETLDRLSESFAKSNFHMRQLMVDIALTAATRGMAVGD